MLKSPQFFTTVALVMARTLTTQPTQGHPQPDAATLNTKLLQAVCTHDWGEAVKIVEQMIITTPSSNQIQHKKLEIYRTRMQSFFDSEANTQIFSKSCSSVFSRSAPGQN